MNQKYAHATTLILNSVIKLCNLTLILRHLKIDFCCDVIYKLPLVY